MLFQIFIANAAYDRCNALHTLLLPSPACWLAIKFDYCNPKCIVRTPWVKKQDTKLSVISSPLLHSREICNKTSLQIPSDVKSVATLPCEIVVCKNFTDRKHNNGRPGVHIAYWRECGRGMWAGTKPIRPATNTSCSRLNCTIWFHTDHLFSPRSWSKVFKETHAWELMQIAMRDSPAQNSCQIMLSLFSPVIKSY